MEVYIKNDDISEMRFWLMAVWDIAEIVWTRIEN